MNTHVFRHCILPAILLLAGRLSAAPDPKFHVYVLAGQSNMAGRGKPDSESTNAHPRVKVLTKDRRWFPATDPLHFDKSIAGVGPGLAFGRQNYDTASARELGRRYAAKMLDMQTARPAEPNGPSR